MMLLTMLLVVILNLIVPFLPIFLLVLIFFLLFNNRIYLAIRIGLLSIVPYLFLMVFKFFSFRIGLSGEDTLVDMTSHIGPIDVITIFVMIFSLAALIPINANSKLLG